MDQALPPNKSCPQCGRYDNRGVSVDAVLIKSEKILLIRRGHEPYKGQWALPGGHVEWDETVEQAVKREFQEETGLTATSLNLIDVFSTPSRDPKQLVAIAYAVEVSNDTYVAGDDAVEVRWWPLAALPPDLAFDHGEIIKAAKTTR